VAYVQVVVVVVVVVGDMKYKWWSLGIWVGTIIKEWWWW